LRSLTECRLYGILDLGYVDDSEVERVIAAMIEGGVDLIQLRGKGKSIAQLSDIAAAVHKVTAPAAVPLIVNDHAEIADRVEVEGVHVGQDDQSVADVRTAVRRHLLVGKSTHSLKQAVAAQAEGADYIGFGPIFATPTKPDYEPIGLEDISQAHSDVELPIFCIGGIKLDNLEQVIAAGAKRVVIVSGLLNAQNIAQYAAKAKQMLQAADQIENQKSKIEN
jgi:thiamine-phosphate pyrophosphorylase